MEEIKRNMKEIKEKVDEIYIDLCQRVNKIDGCINDLKDKIVNLELKETEDITNNNWIPNEMEKYYFIDSLDLMCIDCCYWHDDDIDKARLNHKVIFKTEAEANEYLEYLLEKEKHMNTFTKEEWKNEEICKFFYYYHSGDCELKYSKTWIYRYIKPYFRTEAETKDFIQKYEWQIKHELGVK